MSILLVEDEAAVVAFVDRGLSEEGYVVQVARDATEGATALAPGGIEAVLLDWMLPDAPGISLLRSLRDRGDMTPVIMLTARDAVEDRVAALDAGADDFLSKPFAFDELLARLRALLRRSRSRQDVRLTCGDLVLDPVQHKVTRAGQAIKLTTREFALLQFLLEQGGQPVTRNRIVEKVWEHDLDTFSNVVEVYIRYLRRKVDEPFDRPLIQTVRGVGYAIRPEP